MEKEGRCIEATEVLTVSGNEGNMSMHLLVCAESLEGHTNEAGCHRGAWCGFGVMVEAAARYILSYLGTLKADERPDSAKSQRCAN